MCPSLDFRPYNYGSIHTSFLLVNVLTIDEIVSKTTTIDRGENECALKTFDSTLSIVFRLIQKRLLSMLLSLKRKNWFLV